MKKTIIIFVLLSCFQIILQASTTVDPVKLFVVHDGEKLSLKEIKQRIRYAEELQPRVENDSLVFPNEVKNCPQECIEYVREFIRLLNHYIAKMPEELRFRMLDLVEKNSVRMNVVLAKVKRDGHKTYLDLSRTEARRLGVEREYDKVVQFFSLPSFVPEEKCEEIPDRSIFFNPLNISQEYSIVKDWLHAFYGLNKSWQKKK